MDVELLTRMVGDLILDHDSLDLPGLGSFVAQDMPASFSDRGYTINPPYRRLTFTETERPDGLLAELYARDNGKSQAESAAIIKEFVAGLAATLREEKVVDLPGLGRLRATRENHFFFVADEDLDISPDACGLDSVSLKTHSSVALPDIPVAVAPRKEVPPATKPAENVAEAPEIASPATNQPEIVAEVPEPAPEPVAEAPAPAPEPVKEPAPTPARGRAQRRMPAGARWAIGIAASAALLLGGFVLLSRLAPDFTDKLLYTEEELSILNYPEDGTGLPG